MLSYVKLFCNITNTSWYHERHFLITLKTSDNIYTRHLFIYSLILELSNKNNTSKSRTITIFIILILLNKLFAINRNIYILKYLIRFSTTLSSCKAWRNITRRLSEWYHVTLTYFSFIFHMAQWDKLVRIIRVNQIHIQGTDTKCNIYMKLFRGHFFTLCEFQAC